MKLLILVASLASVAFSAFEGLCNCGSKNAFQQDSYECLKYPKDTKDGAVDGCLSYTVTGNKTNPTWTCTACKVGYQKNGKACQETLEGCTQATAVNNTQANTTTNQTQVNQRRFLADEGKKWECQSCDSSAYFLNTTSKTCITNPTDKHCAVFTNDAKCVTCENGYYKNGTDDVCVEAKKVDNCLTYKKDTNTSQCNSCKEGYVLKEKACKKYSEIVANCISMTHVLNTYTCIGCEKGYYVTNAGKNCTANPDKKENGKIDNCNQYSASATANAPYCIDCGSKVIAYNKTSCVNFNGTKVDNCQGYYYPTAADQECVACESRYNGQKNGTNYIKSCKKCPKNPDSANILSISAVALLVVLALLF